MSKSLPLPVLKVSFTGFSPRTQDGSIVQVAAAIRVDYDIGRNRIKTEDEVIYSGTFKDIIGSPMSQEVKNALIVLATHFGGLVFAEYGVAPS